MDKNTYKKKKQNTKKRYKKILNPYSAKPSHIGCEDEEITN